MSEPNSAVILLQSSSTWMKSMRFLRNISAAIPTTGARSGRFTHSLCGMKNTSLKDKNKRGSALGVVSVQKYICLLLRKTLLKKGCSSNSFPKTFSMKFQPYRVYPERMKLCGFIRIYTPYRAEICIKSLWKGVRGRTFPQKGFTRYMHIILLYGHRSEVKPLFL